MVLHTYTCDYYIFWEYDVFRNYKEIFFISLQTYLSKYEKIQVFLLPTLGFRFGLI